MAWLTSDDLRRWREGRHFESYQRLGAHVGRGGTWFVTWAPHAESVAVIGDFNGWDASAHPMRRAGSGEEGLWEVFVRGAEAGHHYKFRIHRGPYRADKTDPYAEAMEAPVSEGNPVAGLSSIVIAGGYEWGDGEWMASRRGPASLERPVSIYEVHIGSWMRRSDGYSLSYRDVAEPLADYVRNMGFTHVELLPVQEHPYYASWGYQVVGYFAPTFRYGRPDDFRFLVDTLHRHGIGVILDWVPAHFATDPQGLVYFDGSTLYEYDDPRMRFHPDWGTFVFDYNKPGVRNFLVSNANFWLDRYHIDGLRFDAVASMLYRDYSRHDWTPNHHGGRENLEAIDLLKTTNVAVYERHPEVLMIAEESTAWPGVSRPVYDGGLGFLYKWNMGWMHDTLTYMRKDPIHRKHHLHDFTFPLVYAWSENYALPLSHDEVVHGKGSLWGKMPGDPWQKAANLRLLLAHQWGHPGKKLLFMGGEFGQRAEWNHDGGLQWELLTEKLHAGVHEWTRALNALYREQPALWNDRPGGFEWIDFADWEHSVASYLRKPADADGGAVAFIFNFTPVPRDRYRVGLPTAGRWRVLLNSDDRQFGGSGMSPGDTVEAEAVRAHGRPASAELVLPPLGVLVLGTDAGR
jgi:1,4-alpha-glucan branching enzyme